MAKKKIYYAHSMQLYDSVQEMNEHAYLWKLYKGDNLINPKNLEFNKPKKFFDFVAGCDLVVASEIDGFIGKGVFCEIARALSEDIKVLVLRRIGKEYSLEPVIGIVIENENDWKVKYGKIIT
ncbi:MAG: hypothetical protein K9J30_14095 [Bacteroidales bacterium]|nr:hypothetical protein [Bacteroidales bacterium]